MAELIYLFRYKDAGIFRAAQSPLMSIFGTPAPELWGKERTERGELQLFILNFEIMHYLCTQIPTHPASAGVF